MTSARPLLTVVLLLLAYLALGFLVTRFPVAEFDRGEQLFAGRSVGLALFFTTSGTFIVYATLCALTLLAGVLRRGWFPSSLVIVGTFLCAWFSSDLFKELFRRARPEQWYALHETSFSYSSGHATLSLVFYGLWAYMLWRSFPPAPWRAALIALFACWVVAIGWSRLALGAHYPTDLLGGYLLGAIWLLVGMTVVDRLSARPVAT